ncbi:hypothetical protein BDQ12DRAFT_716098 [Crucibulum laeve]|uniref:Rad4 transglutaminase-like domain-containing protein n=1 Tax=Crucibulum laeve TaxID=68775 RepID=A0A5C3LWB8_9AGAR|nr:hypothetical protein BDQ12DRAFT_716098 [Crucibulum laeve]
MSSDVERSMPFEADTENEFDWEEVEVPEQEQKHLEITLQARLKPEVKKKIGISHAERLIRIDCHKIHTVALLGNAWIRNKWIKDELLHARLLSLTPMSLQNAFGMIHKSRVPDQNLRGRMFENAISNLVKWWCIEFFEVIPEGHIRNRTFDEVQRRMDIFVKADQDPDTILELQTLQDILDDDGEQIRSEKSLMKHALMRSGSRDTSAQLFTALCRALAIPSRLVVSLQSMPWQSSIGKPKSKYERKPKGKGKVKSTEKAEDDINVIEMEEVNIPGSASSSVSGSDFKGKGKAKAFAGTGRRLDGGSIPPKSEKAKGKEKAEPVIRLRKNKSKGNVLGSGASTPSSSRFESPDPTTTPPVFWTEVFSRPDARWIPVDPIRGFVNKRKVFDPTPISSANMPSAPSQFGSTTLQHPYALTNASRHLQPRIKQENRMVYVLAFEEDGFARDVTRRYAREYSAKVAKMQGGSSAAGGKGRQAWWDRVVNRIKRPYQLHRDDVEDEELDTAQMMEGMPTTVGGFKDHPIYALARHLKQSETIHPPPPETPELGKFRGEPVYPRSSVVSLKTAENWMRSEGRMVKAGCQPMKMVKVRAGTVNRMRELEVLKDELKEAGPSSVGPNSAGGEIMQGLYARSQTEMYVPDPVIDGKVPKNNFGNIDLYVPSMLPRGAVHVPFKGVAKIARKLVFDFAEAVIGFEFKKRRAFPVIEGVVIAAENESALLEAYREAEREAEEKARFKREDRALKQWTRLIQGLRIRHRLKAQYGSKPNEESSHQAEVEKEEKTAQSSSQCQDEDASLSAGAGFLVVADDVVQAFHLPKYQHVTLPPTPPPIIRKTDGDQELEEVVNDAPDLTTYDLETMDVDSDLEEIPIQPVNGTAMPKTMQEMAEEAERLKEEKAGEPEVEEIQALTAIQLVAKKGPTTKIPSSKASTPTKGSSKQGTPAKTGSRASTRKPSIRKRRRRGKEGEETESSEHEGEPSPRKRVRAKAPPAPTPAPTRTLRPRNSKTPAQVAEEKKAEERFRRAVAQ